MKAKDIMSAPVITVGPQAPLKDVAAILTSRQVSAVPVVSDTGELIGIVSEADLLPLETVPDPRSHLIPLTERQGHVPQTAEEVMTRDVVVAQEDVDVADIARLMMSRRVKRIPIVSGDRVVGIVSRRDLLKVLARSDEDIRREVGELLDDEILMLGRFHVGVAGGVVSLSGPLDAVGRRLAELLARSVPGVIGVEFDDP